MSAIVRPPLSEPAYLAGTMRSTPYGRPPTSSSIHFRSISSCSGVCATAPSTPMPPALVTAATTSRQWVKARIGTSMPNISVMAVFMAGVSLERGSRYAAHVERDECEGAGGDDDLVDGHRLGRAVGEHRVARAVLQRGDAAQAR